MNSPLTLLDERAMPAFDDALRDSAVLRARGVTKRYGYGENEVRALRGVDLDIRRGELVAIMGPSGCGKSTLLHALGGLLTPSSGQIFLAGHELSALTDAARTELRRRHIGFVFQRFNLLSALTVEGNLKLGERIALGKREALRGGPGRRELLEMLGLGSKRNRRPMELSGGEQQRVALARAIVHRPAILLADEPTGSLDSGSSSTVLATLKRVHEELGQTIVIITHDLDVARAAERVVLMKDGEVRS